MANEANLGGPRFGWFASPALHAMAVAATLIAWRGPPVELGAATTVPVEIVTSSEETNIRAAAPEVAEVAPAFEDRGETMSSEAPPPPEPLPAVEPLPVPRREEPRRPERLNIDDLDALLNRDNAERGNRARDAAPNADRSQRPREAQGAGTALTATQTARISSLLAAQISECARSTADRADPDLRVGLRFRLTRAGALDGAPVITRSSGDRAFDDSALRAVRLCAPYDLGDLQAAAAGVDLLTNYAPGAGQ